MIEIELFDGTVLEFPDGTPDEVMDRVAAQETAAARGQMRAAPEQAPQVGAAPPALAAPPAPSATPAIPGPAADAQGVVRPAPPGPDPERVLDLVRGAGAAPSAPPLMARQGPTPATAFPPQGVQRAPGLGVDTAPLPVAEAAPLPPGVTPYAAPPPVAPEPPSTLGGLVSAFGAGTSRPITGLAEAGVEVSPYNLATRGAAEILSALGLDEASGAAASAAAEPGAVGRLMRLGYDEYRPQNAAERVLARAGEELSATALLAGGPMASAVGKARGFADAARASGRAATGAEARAAGRAELARRADDVLISRTSSIPARVVATAEQAMARSPAAAIGAETALGLGAGLGAGAANEVAPGSLTADLVGSTLGGLGAAGTMGLARAGGDLANVLLGRGGGRVVEQAAVERLLRNSTAFGRQLEEVGSNDTRGLARALRAETPVERAVPGFRADIADRLSDPTLGALVRSADIGAPGASVGRQASNDVAIANRMAGFEQSGDPARARADVQAGVAAEIARAEAARDQAAAALEDARASIAPGMGDASARGAEIRAGLEDAYRAAQAQVDGLYDQLRELNVAVSPEPFADALDAATRALGPFTRAEYPAPEPGIMRGLATPPEPSTPAAPVPLGDILDARSTLGQRVRSAQAANDPPGQRVFGGYREAIDRTLPGALAGNPQAADILGLAAAARRDVADRFERPGTDIAAALRERPGGGYAAPDSGVPRKFVQPDAGRTEGFTALMREAGGDPRVRAAIADDIMADVQRRGLADKPQQLERYLGERGVVLAEFPELRANLEAAGAASAASTAAAKEAEATAKALSPGGPTPEGKFLAYPEDQPAAAIGTVLAAKDPGGAARALIGRAGTDTARGDLRKAFFDRLMSEGQMSRQSQAGVPRYNPHTLEARLGEEKTAAVARELWADNPEQLEDIKSVLSALRGADLAAKQGQRGSGSAQGLNASAYDAALTPASIASRIRSVNRGQLSPTIAVVDLASTGLRRLQASRRAGAIGELVAEMANDPELTALLLEKYNPASYGNVRRSVVQRYGQRLPWLVQALDETNAEVEAELAGGD
jgi:hypothetical protein